MIYLYCTDLLNHNSKLINQTMDRKTYIAPEIEIISIETIGMLAASAGDIPVVGGEGGEILSNKRRGTWGNLWSEGEE